MKRVRAGAALLMVGIAALSAGADRERKLSIRAVMHKQYTVSNSPFVRIKKKLNSTTPDWEKVREATRIFASLAVDLQKSEPRWGERESWARFTGLHFGDAKAMDDAAEARDQGAVLVAHQRLAASCTACHNAHRYRGRN
jgi:hypothetical protein